MLVVRNCISFVHNYDIHSVIHPMCLWCYLVLDAMSKPYWVLDDVLGVVQLMSCIRTDRLQQSRISK